MIEECQDRTPKALQNYADRILLMTGDQDVILDTGYNHEFCIKNKIRELHYPASHSLFESFDAVEAASRAFFRA